MSSQCNLKARVFMLSAFEKTLTWEGGADIAQGALISKGSETGKVVSSILVVLCSQDLIGNCGQLTFVPLSLCFLLFACLSELLKWLKPPVAAVSSQPESLNIVFLSTLSPSHAMLSASFSTCFILFLSHAPIFLLLPLLLLLLLLLIVDNSIPPILLAFL